MDVVSILHGASISAGALSIAGTNWLARLNEVGMFTGIVFVDSYQVSETNQLYAARSTYFLQSAYPLVADQ